MKASVYVAAMQRHLLKWFHSQDNDVESGVSHLAHVAACCNILMDAMFVDSMIDDRPEFVDVDAEFAKLTTESKLNKEKETHGTKQQTFARA